MTEIEQIPNWTGTQQAYEQSTFQRRFDTQAKQLGKVLGKQVTPNDFVFCVGLP